MEPVLIPKQVRGGPELRAGLGEGLLDSWGSMLPLVRLSPVPLLCSGLVSPCSRRLSYEMMFC